MAKLNPPNLAGTLPSFYTDLSGTTNIVVPFSMNASVSRAAVKGLLLRIKRTTVDTLVDTLFTENWDDENFTVTFSLASNSETIQKMVKGNYYKLQLAYYTVVNGVREDGYFSTAAIAKYTECPSVIIQGLESGVINSVNQVEFYGQYNNLDVSEKVYQYRFIIQSSKRDQYTNVLELKTFVDTDWKIHDSSQDTELTSSVDLLSLNEMLDSSTNYIIQYKIITTNGLEIASPQYSIQNIVAIGEELGLVINSELDYENGRVKITMRPNTDVNNLYETFNGYYYLQRADSNSNFTNWLLLYSFESYEQVRGFVFYDYAVESGVAYKYGLQRINSQNVLSLRTVTYDPIVVYFEDAFLFDGDRQLKIRYNSNISTFKEIISETKKTTLGSKYPLIFRHGNLCYKEFPITGLLTYLSDRDELFISKDELLAPSVLSVSGSEIAEHVKITTGKKQLLSNWAIFQETTNPTDDNIAAEKTFAMTALSWLNNGKIKLFKSPQEGNFIVKLMNVSLAPFNGTNRMIHTFTATADEIQPYSPSALLEYDLLISHVNIMGDNDSPPQPKTFNIAEIRSRIQDNYSYIDSATERNQRIIEALEAYDWSQGYAVSRVQLDIPSGVYARLWQWGDTSFMVGIDGKYDIEKDKPFIGQLRLLPYTSNKQELLGATGTLTLYIRQENEVTISSITKQTVLSYLGWSGYGNQLVGTGNGQSRNIIQDFTGTKYLVNNVYRTVIHSFPEISRANLYSQWDTSSFATTKQQWILLYGEFVTYKDTSTNNYYRYNPISNSLVQFTPSKTIRTKKASNALTDITQYDSGSGENIDINYSDPNEVYWTLGNDVYTNFFYSVNKINYSFEDDPGLYTQKQTAEELKRDWCKYVFNLVEINSQPSDPNTLLFIWTGNRFAQILVSEWFNYSMNYVIYTVYSGVYSFNQINSAYNAYRTQEVILESEIKNTISNQS